MNEIHQISLKLRLGIDPGEMIEPERLLALWEDRCNQSLQQKVREQRRRLGMNAEKTPATRRPL